MKWILVFVALSTAETANTFTFDDACATREACQSSFGYQWFTPPLNGIGAVCLPWDDKVRR